MPAILQLTDGTTTINLLGEDGYVLDSWRPATPDYKRGGTWQDSSLANGRRLVDHKWAHAIETFRLKATEVGQDQLIQETQELRRLLEKAADYWTSNWQDEPVYLIAKASKETNTRYAIIHRGRIPEDGNPMAQPFLQPRCAAVMDRLTLVIERGHWQHVIPGSDECIEASGKEAWCAVEELGFVSMQQADDFHIINAAFSNSDTYLQFGNPAAADSDMGMRFRYVDIPQGSVIRSAYIEFVSASNQAGTTCNADIYGEDADDATAVASAIDFAARTLTTAKVDWNGIAAWVQGTVYQSPDISTIIQEIVDRDGWESGNNINVFLYDDSSSAGAFREAASWDSTAYRPPILYLEWTNCNGQAVFLSYGAFTLDDFDRANTGPPPGPNWLDDVGTQDGLEVSGNEVKSSAGGPNDVSYWNDTFGPNWEVGIEASAVEANWKTYLGVSYTDNDWPGDFDAIYYDSTPSEFSLQVIETGVASTTLITVDIGGVITATDEIGCKKCGTTLQGYYKPVGATGGTVWIKILQAETTTFVNRTGMPLMVLSPGAGDLARLDNFVGRNFAREDCDTARTFGRTETCTDEVFVVNKYNEAQITNIHYWDSTGGAWSGNILGSLFPQSLLPAAPAVGDVVVFGVDTAIADSGPFNNLVFDIETAQTDLTTLTWRYSDAAADPTGWAALTVQDNTNASGAMTGDAFDTTGVNSVHWDQPDDWQAQNPQVGAGAALGITGFWVTAHVVAIGAAPATPTQQNREIYTTTWPRVTVASNRVLGDIDSLLRVLMRNASGSEGDGTLPGAAASFAYAGLRSTSRGDDFCAYLPASDEQLPTGIGIGAVSAVLAVGNDTTAPSGRSYSGTPAAAFDTDPDLRWIINTAQASQYIGRYRAFVRCWYDTSGGGAADDIDMQLKYGTNTDGMTSTNIVNLPSDNDWYLLDMGAINLGVGTLSPSEVLVELYIELYTRSAGAGDLYVYDVIILPVDEWAIEARDEIGDGSLNVNYLYYLDVDSVINPRVMVRAWSRLLSNDRHAYEYAIITNGEAIIHANREQRLWFIMLYYDVSNSQYEANPTISSRISLTGANRYLSMRGDR